MTSLHSIIKHIPWVRIHDQSIVANPSQNSLLLLNQSATKIWGMLAAGHQPEKISQQLAQDYAIDLPSATNDVTLIIEHWRQSGLLDDDSNEYKANPWEKEKQSGDALRSEEPMCQLFYQLSNTFFAIDYYHADSFKNIHAVFQHLQVDPDPGKDVLTNVCRYQIRFDDCYQLLASHNQSLSFDCLDELVEVIQWSVIEMAYRHTDWLTILHSAALGGNNGKAIVLIAQRGSGKSTLTRLLQEHNFIYLADDVVPIDLSGSLQPMPMCQRFKQGSWDLLNIQDRVHDKTYARREGHYVKYVTPLTGQTKDWAMKWPVKTIIYPQYNTHCKQYKLKKLSHVESIIHLCQSGSVFGGAIDQAQLESIISWVQCIESYSLNYSHISTDLVDQINSLTQ